MIPVLDTNAWIEKLRELERPGADNILAFYEHRFGAICRDPRLMLAPLDDHLVHRGDGVFENHPLHRAQGHPSRCAPAAARQLRRRAVPHPALPHRGNPGHRARRSQGRRRTRRQYPHPVRTRPGGFGIALKECPQPSLYVAAYRVPVRTDAWYDKGLTAFRSDVPVKPAMFAASDDQLPFRRLHDA